MITGSQRIKLRPYRNYKASDIDWADSIPEHWNTRRLSNSLLSHASGVWGADADGVNDLPCIRVADFNRDHSIIRADDPTIRAITPSERQGKILRAGNLLLEKSGGGEKQPVGTVVLYDHDLEATCSNFIEMLVVQGEYDPRYLKFAHSTLYALGVNKRSIKQTTGIQNIDLYSYLSESFPVPTLEEQSAIVRYLDRAGEQIQRYIAAKERLIALLEEQRQALVHQAVTRGLDPNVRLRDSRVEWLGDVPDHWEVRRIRSITEMRVSNVDKHTKEEEIPVRLCNYTDVYKNEVIDQALEFMPATASPAEVEKFRLEEQDVLITKDSETWDDIGIPALVVEPSEDLICGYHLAILRPREEITGSFLNLALRTQGAKVQFNIQARGVTRYGLTHNSILSVQLPLPPHQEQQAIVDYLTEANEGINETVARSQHQIDLMNEYRTRLIADVVTGQLDVREAAAQIQETPLKNKLSDEIVATREVSGR